MVFNIVFLTSALLSLHVASSYILLTANLEDFHAIVKQIAASPVGTEINQIIRRASSLFSEQLNELDKPQKRTDNKITQDSFEVWKPEAIERAKESASDSDSISEKDEEYLKGGDRNLVERRAANNDLGDVGRNASYYLQSIKKIFENV